jgi:hypothetical protein
MQKDSKSGTDHVVFDLLILTLSYSSTGSPASLSLISLILLGDLDRYCTV